MENKTPKILIVDDKVENLVALEVLLKKLDVILVRALSGNEAIALTLEHDFALALIDVQMPEMDGFEVAELLHHEAKTEHLPIIFVSAIYTGEAFKVKGVESGAIDFIEKPIVPQILLGKVRLFLELYEHRTRVVKQSIHGIVNNVSDGVILINDKNVIQMVNPAAESILGLAKEQLINSTFNHEYNLDHSVELTLENDTGEFRKIEVNTTSMIWQGAKAYVVSLHDITEREREKKSLELALKEAERSNQELERFAYVASHDLQEPLRAISGYVQLLSRRYREQLDDEAMQFIDYTTEAAVRLKTLINDLLTYSRIKQNFNNLAEIDLNETIKNTLFLLDTTIREANAEIEISNLPTVKAQPVLMGQLFQNLISNSIKYRSENNPKIQIASLTKQDHYLFSICDNGIGIEEKYADRVFEVFQRLHTMNEYSGTGIGLALCKKIVQLHGGEIWFKSDSGEGTTFYFTLPKSISSEPDIN